MKSPLLNFAVAVFLAVPGVAQVRSTISAGPMHSAGPFNSGHSPGIAFRPGFGRHFNRNGFATIFYPYGFYDDSYDSMYDRSYPEQPTPPVVIVHDAPAAAPVMVAPAEPRMIEVSEAAAVPSNLTKTPMAVFILSDGRRLESQNYTITDSILSIKELHRPAMQVPLDQLNIPATLTENHQRGLDLRLPESSSEILIGF